MSKHKKTADRHDSGQPQKDSTREQGRSSERRQDHPKPGGRQNTSAGEQDMDRGSRRNRDNRSDERSGVL